MKDKVKKIINDWLRSKNPRAVLKLDNLDLTTFPDVPKCVKEISLDSNNIKNIDAVPENIEHLNISRNPMTSLHLTSKLLYLNVSFCNIVSIDFIPPRLVNFDCSHNHIVKLPPLPLKLRFFACEHNSITILGNIPPEMDTLHCSYNYIFEMPKELGKLIELDINHNLIEVIDNLPSTLVYLSCNHNPLKTLTVPKNITYLSCSNCKISELIVPGCIEKLYCHDNVNLKKLEGYNFDTLIDYKFDETSRKRKHEEVDDELVLADITESIIVAPVEELSLPFSASTARDIERIATNYRGDCINTTRLFQVLPALRELDSLIGLEEIKRMMYDFVIYTSQGLHTVMVNNKRTDEGDLYHTVLLSKPGYGKSTVSGIIGRIYSQMLFGSNKVVSVNRADLIGEYIGHTEKNTRDVLEKSMGGTLILDEAYSLAGTEDRIDVFAQACIDLIMRYLTERKRDFVCIIIGYEDKMQRFFSVNPGLQRRFPMRIVLPEYSAKDLCKIFHRRCELEGWKYSGDETVKENAFITNFKYFTDMGGDIDILFLFCKTIYSKRIFGFSNASDKQISEDDFIKGMDKLIKLKKAKESNLSTAPLEMYI